MLYLFTKQYNLIFHIHYYISCYISCIRIFHNFSRGLYIIIQWLFFCTSTLKGDGMLYLRW